MANELGVLFNTDRLSAEEFGRYAARLDELTYHSLWLPELFTREPFATAGYLLGQTQRITLATGIANLYARDAVATVSAASALQELSGGRFILGLGVSNARLNQARGHQWQPPVTKLETYLQAMATVKLTAPQFKPPTYVAAHGPRMLATVAQLAEGATTYLMPLSHVTSARSLLGADRALTTMLFCLQQEDPALARPAARKAIAFYIGLDYYHRAWLAQGFNRADFVDGGSDRLVDALVAWGSTKQIKNRITQQLAAGANRVVVIPLSLNSAISQGQPDWTLLESLSTFS